PPLLEHPRQRLRVPLDVGLVRGDVREREEIEQLAQDLRLVLRAPGADAGDRIVRGGAERGGERENGERALHGRALSATNTGTSGAPAKNVFGSFLVSAQRCSQVMPPGPA